MSRQDHIEMLDFIIRQCEAAKKTTSHKKMRQLADGARIQAALLIRDLDMHLGLIEPDEAHMRSNERHDSGK